MGSSISVYQEQIAERYVLQLHEPDTARLSEDESDTESDTASNDALL
jgi:hypothetical protein